MCRLVRRGIASDTLAAPTCQPGCNGRQSVAFAPRQGLLKRAPRLFEHAGKKYGHRGTIGMIVKGTGFRSETAEIVVVEEVP